MNGITWQAIPAFFIVGAGLYFWGRHLNVTGPAKKLAAQTAQRSAEVAEVEATAITAIHLNPGQPALTQEEEAALKRKQNRYTMLFIPIQWWGFLLPIIGTVVSFANINNSN